MVNTGEIMIKSLKEQRKLALEELRYYHLELLKKQVTGEFDVNILNIRRRMFFLTKFIIKIENLSQKITLRVIDNKSYPTYKGKTYIFTSAGDYDVEMALRIASGASLVNISKNQTINPKIEAELLMSNMLLREDSLTADEITKLRLANLSSRNNDISFPELTPNKYSFAQVNELNPLIAKIIINSNSSVIPVALEQIKEGNKIRYYANIGKNFELSGINSEYTKDILKIIYDELTNLKREIWQQLGLMKQISNMGNQDLDQIKLIKNK